MEIRSAIRVQTVALSLLIASVAHAQKDPAVTDSARQHFKAGVAYIQDPSGPKYEEALQEFRKAYAESPTPKIMNNIGFSALNLERDGEAIEAYEVYLAGNSSDLTPAIRKQVEKDVAMLKASLVKVQITAQPKNASIVDERRNSKGELVVNRYKLAGGGAALGIHPGHHKVIVSAPGYEDAAWEFDAEPAQTFNHDFILVAEGGASAAKSEVTMETPLVVERRKASKQGVHSMVYVGGSAAGVFAVAATVTGMMTLSKQNDFDEAKKHDEPKKLSSLETSGGRLALITDIGIGAAVVSACVATYFYFTSPSKPVEKVASPTALRIAPAVNVERAVLSLAGSF